MDAAKAKSIIPAVLKKLQSSYGVSPFIGIEQEFYLQNLGDQKNQNDILDEIRMHCGELSQEKGWQQYEYVINFSPEIMDVAALVYEKRNIIRKIAAERGASVLFDSKPYTEDYGSALHMHVSLHNDYGINLYSDYNTEENTYIQHSIGGLLSLLEESIYLICNKEKDFHRFTASYNAPVNSSWGGNNRTTALRIPESASKNRRIEYRVAPSDADPYTVLACILIGIYHGLSNKIKPPERIYGDASHQQYNLKAFTHIMEEAEKIYNDKGNMKSYNKNILSLIFFLGDLTINLVLRGFSHIISI